MSDKSRVRIRLSDDVVCEIEVPTHDVEIFNVDASGGGSDAAVNLLGAEVAAGASAVAASGTTTAIGVTVDLEGADAAAESGTVAVGLDEPDPGQDTRFNGMDTWAIVPWQASDSIVHGFLWDVSPQHIAKFAGVFSNPSGEDFPASLTGPKLRRAKISLADLWPRENRFDWSAMDDMLNNLPSKFDGVHLNIRGNNVLILNKNNQQLSEQTAPQWLIEKAEAQGKNILWPVETGQEDESDGPYRFWNLDLTQNIVQKYWEDFLTAFIAQGYGSHPKLHNILLHGVSNSLGEEWTGDQAGTTQAEEAMADILDLWITAFAGDEQKLMWLNSTDELLWQKMLDAEAGVRLGGAVERWMANKYHPGAPDEVGLVAEAYNQSAYSGDEKGEFYLVQDPTFPPVARAAAIQEQNERGYKESEKSHEWHYRMAHLRCLQIRCDNVFIPQDAKYGPEMDNWLAWQLGQQPEDLSAEAWIHFGQWVGWGGAQLQWGIWRLNNMEHYLHQREYHGATTPKDWRDYDKNINGTKIDKTPSLAGGYQARAGTSIQIACNPLWASGPQAVRWSLTYKDSGTGSFEIVFDTNAGADTGRRTVIKQNSGQVRTVTFYCPEFRADATGLNPDFSIEDGGNTHFFFLRGVKY